jgi:hypothetical protein
MDDQNDGHTVDDAVGQLRVEAVELGIDAVVDDVSVILDGERSVELDEGPEEDDDDGEETDAVLEVASGVSAVLDGAGATEPDDDNVALEGDGRDEEPGVVLTVVPEMLVPDVDEDADCTAQDDTAELEPAKYTFKRSAAPHVSAVLPRHGM